MYKLSVMEATPQTAQTTIADLALEITHWEDAAQNAEDRDQMHQASKFRAKARDAKTRLDALVAGQS